MEEHNIEIEIAPDGQVKVHVKGAKGARCLRYVEFLSQAVGPVSERQLTQEYYEPEGKVRVDAEDVQRVADSEG
jgi:hypothetical protein